MTRVRVQEGSVPGACDQSSQAVFIRILVCILESMREKTTTQEKQWNGVVLPHRKQ